MEDSTKKSTKGPTRLISPGSIKIKKTKRDCSIHGEYEANQIAIGFKGRPIMSMCPTCAEEREIEEKKRLVWEERQRVEERVRDCDVPKRFLNITVNKYDPVCPKAKTVKKIIKEYVRCFDELKEAGASLVMCGKPGTGKTHLACAIGLEVAKTYHAKYVTVFQLMSRVKETYHKDSDETVKGVINNYIHCDLLIIDEIGIQYGSDHEKIIFYQIINGRYENVKPTILISNLTESELTEFIGERCIDRMREGGGAVIAFDWDSYRGKG